MFYKISLFQVINSTEKTLDLMQHLKLVAYPIIIIIIIMEIDETDLHYLPERQTCIAKLYILHVVFKIENIKLGY